MHIFQKVTQFNFSQGFLFLLLSGFISTILSISIDMTGLELGALINYFWPGFLTIALVVAFRILCLITKKVVVRLWTLVILCAYLIYVGTALHFGKDYWPLVMW
jgi:hypothetical protein